MVQIVVLLIIGAVFGAYYRRKTAAGISTIALSKNTEDDLNQDKRS
jgi:hypothetical protein